MCTLPVPARRMWAPGVSQAATPTLNACPAGGGNGQPMHTLPSKLCCSSPPAAPHLITRRCCFPSLKSSSNRPCHHLRHPSTCAHLHLHHHPQVLLLLTDQCVHAHGQDELRVVGTGDSRAETSWAVTTSSSTGASSRGGDSGSGGGSSGTCWLAKQVAPQCPSCSIGPLSAPAAATC